MPRSFPSGQWTDYGTLITTISVGNLAISVLAGVLLEEGIQQKIVDSIVSYFISIFGNVAIIPNSICITIEDHQYIGNIYNFGNL